MKPFRFRAAALLHLRHRQRDLARTALSRATAAAHESEAEKGRADERVQHAVGRYKEALGETPEAGAIDRHRIWIASQTDAAAASGRAHADASSPSRPPARRVRDAHRQVRMLERLRERMLARHAEAVRQQELKANDELATLRYATREKEGGLERER